MRSASWWCGVVPDAAALTATCIVFVFALLVYRNPATRPALGRQSLHMLVAVQLATLLFSSSHIATFVLSHNPRLCEISVLAVLFTNNFQHFVVMFVAVNLQLTVVHNISTAGYTKWYIGSSLIASFIICVPSAVARVWGYDPLVDSCWTVLTDKHERIYWTVGTAYAWTLLSAAVTIVSTLAVISVLFLSSLRVKTAFVGAGLSSGGIADQRVVRSVTLRILPHPVFLILSNIVVVSTDLFVSLYRKPTSTDHETAINPDTFFDIMFALFYTTPPLFFALTFLLFDPSLSTAIRKLFRKEPTILGCTYPDARVSYSLPIPLSTVNSKTTPFLFSYSDLDPAASSSTKINDAMTQHEDTQPPTTSHTQGRIPWLTQSRVNTAAVNLNEL